MATLSRTIVVLAAVGGAVAQQTAWGQCGGIGWSGATSCVSGYYCYDQNPYYSQCIPGSGSGGGSSSSTSTTTRAATSFVTSTTTAAPSTTSTVAGSTPTSPAEQTICAQYGTWSGSGYNLENNLWGEAGASGSQCSYLYSASNNGISWSTTWSWSGAQNTVKSYAFSGRQISTGQLISSITSMPTTVTWSYSTTNGMNADVSYDLFTASNPNHATSSGDYELMIWLDKIGSITPIGGSPSVSNINIGGQTWNLYMGTNGSQKTFSFVAANGPLTSWSGDVKDFWTYLAENQGYPQSSQYLLTFEFGTEAFSGGPTQFYVENWSANVS